MTTHESTGQKIARFLVANGVDTVFGIPGAHTYDFSDALHEQQDALRFILTRHEQGAGYMAYGYAKSSGKAGVYTVVPGPGVLNSGAALCTAYGANAPVCCITGNIMSHLIGRGRGQLHELNDQLALLRGLTKAAERIDHPSMANNVMSDLFGRMMSGRQRPVAAEIPWDVFGQAGVREDSPVARPFAAPVLDQDAVEAAAKLIASAKNPLIMVGGGAVNAASEIRELARVLQAPVVAHRSGKGIVPDDVPYSLNAVAGYEYWEHCDLLIGIGSRLELQHMRWRWLPKNLKTIRIDVDPTEMVRLKPDVAIVADAKEGTNGLLNSVSHAIAPREKEFSELKLRAGQRLNSISPQLEYLVAIREVLPRDGFFVEEICQMGFSARLAFPVYDPRQYVTCGYQDNLGFGFNTALGVKVANPDKAVVSISGDGGFMFGVQELATAVQHGINVVSIVFDNKAYGNVRRDQQQTYGGRLIGADLVNPDFAALAESFGVRAWRADSPEALKLALSQALALGAPALIHVPMETGSEANPWPLIHPAPHKTS
ncbi:MAG: thiamine pyrophosphate-dependent enzyme [Pseudomonadota bacterium]